MPRVHRYRGVGGRRWSRVLLGVSALALTLAFAPAAGAGVFVYPSSQSIPPSGRLPQGSAQSVTLNTGIDEREGAWIVVTGAQNVSATIDGFGLGPIKAGLYFGHFVNFSGRAVPDALLPWDGRARPVEKPNQPLYLQILVPDEAAPGGYQATVNVTADGKTTSVPVTITVFNVHLPAPNAVEGNLLTSFHVVPESYVNKVDDLYHLGSNAARSAANQSLFAFLAANRISPGGWGFGDSQIEAGSYVLVL